MGFINKRQYLELKHREDLRNARLISIQDFKDQSDRTLTISRDRLPSSVASVLFRHIFILDGKLSVHTYEVNKTGEFETITWRDGDFLEARDVEPTIRRGSSVTDYELAEIMENLHMPISFYVPESSYGQESPTDENFFGLTKASWNDERDF